MVLSRKSLYALSGQIYPLWTAWKGCQRALFPQFYLHPHTNPPSLSRWQSTYIAVSGAL